MLLSIFFIYIQFNAVDDEWHNERLFYTMVILIPRVNVREQKRAEEMTILKLNYHKDVPSIPVPSFDMFLSQ